MSFSDSTHAGSPFGARWDDQMHAGPAPRAERLGGRNPWADSGDGDGLRLRAVAVPKARIPGGPGPDDDLPCVGRWDLFDTEEPSPEALSLCASCPFREWCLETATTNREHFTWAGTNREDRLNRGRELAA